MSSAYITTNELGIRERQSLNCIKNKIIKYGEKRFSIWRIEFLHPAMWHDYDIDIVNRESWPWIRQVTAPCNVIRGSGMTSHWIRPNILELYIWFQFKPNHRSRHVILQQSPIFFSKSDQSRQKKRMLGIL